MKLYRVKIRKDELCRLEDKEKVLFVQLSNLFNELNILHRALICSNKSASSEVETRAHNSQSLFFLEILAGKLWEGWEMLKRNYFGSQLSKYFNKLLTDEGKDALEEIKQYFNQYNLIYDVRNNYAFHYGENASDKIMERIRTINEGEEHDIYISNLTSNCFFYFSEMIMTSAMLNGINPNDDWEALDRLFQEVLDIAKNYLNFIKDCFTVMARKMDVKSEEIIEIPEPPSLDDVVLPCFIKGPR